MDYLTDTAYTTKDQVAAAIRGVQMQQTPMILLIDFGSASKGFATHPGHGNLAPFLTYVHANYHLTKVFRDTETWDADVWERNSGVVQTHK